MKGTRKIKQENYKGIEIKNIPNNSRVMNPITMSLYQNKEVDPICLTKFNIDKKSNNFYIKKYNCKTDPNNYQKYLYLPPIGLFSRDILTIYQIESVDSLTNFIEETENIYTLNRVLNCWVRQNLDLVKNNNNFLVKIYSKLLSNIYKNRPLAGDLEKLIKDYIDKWLQKKSENELYFDLYSDLINFISNK